MPSAPYAPYPSMGVVQSMQAIAFRSFKGRAVFLFFVWWRQREGEFLDKFGMFFFLWGGWGFGSCSLLLCLLYFLFVLLHVVPFQ